MGAKSRTKGAVAEREVCRLLTAEFGANVARRLEQSRDAGNDIDLEPFRIEVKRRKLLGLHAWMDQAKEACKGTDELPVVFTRGDNKEWLVVMRFDDWAMLAREEIVDALPKLPSVRAGLTD